MNTFNNKPGGGNRARPLANKSNPAGTPAAPFHPPVKPIRTETDKPVRSRASGVSQAAGTPKSARKLNTHENNAPYQRTGGGNNGATSKGRPANHTKQIKQHNTPVSGGRSNRENQSQISQAQTKAFSGPGRGYGLPQRRNGMPAPKQMSKQQSKPDANVQGRRMEPPSPAPRIARAPSLPPSLPVWPPKPPTGMAGKKTGSEGQAVPPALRPPSRALGGLYSKRVDAPGVSDNHCPTETRRFCDPSWPSGMSGEAENKESASIRAGFIRFDGLSMGGASAGREIEKHVYMHRINKRRDKHGINAPDCFRRPGCHNPPQL